MTNRARASIVLVLLTQGLSGCDGETPQAP